jgi:hypothetical protein
MKVNKSTDLNHIYSQVRSQDSSVGIAVGYWLDGQDSVRGRYK